MNADTKRQFIEDLMTGMKNSILANVDKMPEEWDGHELRQYIADYVNDQAVIVKMHSTRLRSYRNVVYTKNL